VEGLEDLEDQEVAQVPSKAADQVLDSHSTMISHSPGDLHHHSRSIRSVRVLAVTEEGQEVLVGQEVGQSTSAVAQVHSKVADQVLDSHSTMISHSLGDLHHSRSIRSVKVLAVTEEGQEVLVGQEVGQSTLAVVPAHSRAAAQAPGVSHLTTTFHSPAGPRHLRSTRSVKALVAVTAAQDSEAQEERISEVVDLVPSKVEVPVLSHSTSSCQARRRRSGKTTERLGSVHMDQ
jgi:hypothetical protein